jgi:glycosyltransferase involved in cell wall biosynthesis
MKLSIVLNFYNMRREAKRTLYSLSRFYQAGVEDIDYDIVIIDNGSTEPLDPNEIRGMGENYKYVYYDADSPSPCRAINQIVKSQTTDYVMCCIDGARIFSPGIVSKCMLMAKTYTHPFVYTVNMHIGNQLQFLAIEDGYCQQVEDKLLASVDWQDNGYRLFNISCFGGSAKNGFFSRITESNTLFVKKSDFIDIGGFNERFMSPGGGLCNLDIFNKLNSSSQLTPVLLLGEATFHQFHGGTITNAKKNDRQLKFDAMHKEYEKVIGQQYQSIFKSPIYFDDCIEKNGIF